ncbi:hypothetical protein J8273_5344 [Carpediemonas membranifera]|uniref:Uncharacterized protein n=1 Tax=Carpediemonas membranifera TaxID=201153 RepID=A0A8J6B3R5_9EUKA|nr:hypothetical protein J8273_5344 [Carpediemonas membranifera]|eukprot:KAG9392354.1 hypothetical protein J8273_5344 [Carpediemonas membranifera]
MKSAFGDRMEVLDEKLSALLEQNPDDELRAFIIVAKEAYDKFGTEDEEACPASLVVEFLTMTLDEFSDDAEARQDPRFSGLLLMLAKFVDPELVYLYAEDKHVAPLSSNLILRRIGGFIAADDLPSAAAVARMGLERLSQRLDDTALDAFRAKELEKLRQSLESMTPPNVDTTHPTAQPPRRTVDVADIRAAFEETRAKPAPKAAPKLEPKQSPKQKQRAVRKKPSDPAPSFTVVDDPTGTLLRVKLNFGKTWPWQIERPGQLAYPIEKFMAGGSGPEQSLPEVFIARADEWEAAKNRGQSKRKWKKVVFQPPPPESEPDVEQEASRELPRRVSFVEKDTPTLNMPKDSPTISLQPAPRPEPREHATVSSLRKPETAPPKATLQTPKPATATRHVDHRTPGLVEPRPALHPTPAEPAREVPIESGEDDNEPVDLHAKLADFAPSVTVGLKATPLVFTPITRATVDFCERIIAAESDNAIWTFDEAAFLDSIDSADLSTPDLDALLEEAGLTYSELDDQPAVPGSVGDLVDMAAMPDPALAVDPAGSPRAGSGQDIFTITASVSPSFANSMSFEVREDTICRSLEHSFALPRTPGRVRTPKPCTPAPPRGENMPSVTPFVRDGQLPLMTPAAMATTGRRVPLSVLKSTKVTAGDLMRGRTPGRR